MPFTLDEILDQIDGFGRFQKITLFVFGYVAIITLDCFPTVIVTFITAEPFWVCVTGKKRVCNFTEPVKLTSEHYNARCSMPREHWRYADGFTSTVTEVSYSNG